MGKRARQSALRYRLLALGLLITVLTAVTLFMLWPQHMVLLLFRDVPMLLSPGPRVILEAPVNGNVRLQLLCDRDDEFVGLCLAKREDSDTRFFPVAVEFESRARYVVLELRYDREADVAWVVKHDNQTAETIAWLKVRGEIFVSREYGRHGAVGSYSLLNFGGMGSEELPEHATPGGGIVLGTASWCGE